MFADALVAVARRAAVVCWRTARLLCTARRAVGAFRSGIASSPSVGVKTSAQSKRSHRLGSILQVDAWLSFWLSPKLFNSSVLCFAKYRSRQVPGAGYEYPLRDSSGPLGATKVLKSRAFVLWRAGFYTHRAHLCCKNTTWRPQDSFRQHPARVVRRSGSRARQGPS